MSIFYITILYNAENVVEMHKLIDISILKVLVGVIPKKRRMKPKYFVCFKTFAIPYFGTVLHMKSYFNKPCLYLIMFFVVSY